MGTKEVFHRSLFRGPNCYSMFGAIVTGDPRAHSGEEGVSRTVVPRTRILQAGDGSPPHRNRNNV